MPAGSFTTQYFASSTAPVDDEPSQGAVLCLPGVYLDEPEDCLPAGPSAYLTRMARQGIYFPLKALPAAAPDPNLAISPYYYARLKENEQVPIYSTAEEAVAKNNPVQFIEEGGLRYISYVDEFYREEGKKPSAFMLRSGGWVSSSSVSSRENATIRYQGAEFHSTPGNSFGWVLPLNPTVETKRTPGYANDDYTGHMYTEYDLVQVYSTQTVADAEWYLVGPEEWIEGRMIGRVLPNPVPPEGVTNKRWIEINLYEQTVAVYENSRLVYASLIASGAEPFYTRPGLFQIYKKHEATPMSGSFESDRSDYYHLQDVPWTMYYDDARAIHGAYWRTRFGFPQSHGCVNVSPGDAHWLFNWAEEGDWVYVWDPSGETPTDPEFYTPGGA